MSYPFGESPPQLIVSAIHSELGIVSNATPAGAAVKAHVRTTIGPNNNAACTVGSRASRTVVEHTVAGKHNGMQTPILPQQLMSLAHQSTCLCETGRSSVSLDIRTRRGTAGVG
jgi:hypothetical protein